MKTYYDAKTSGQDATVLGADSVKVGVAESAQKEVNGSVVAIQTTAGKTIYDSSAVKKNGWFILDLETGSRGWYPGGEAYGIINDGHVVEIKEEAIATSARKTVFTGGEIKILDTLDANYKKTLWYRVQYKDIIGYMESKSIDQIVYRTRLA